MTRVEVWKNAVVYAGLVVGITAAICMAGGEFWPAYGAAATWWWGIFLANARYSGTQIL